MPLLLLLLLENNTYDALKHLAKAAEAKNLLVTDQIMLQECLANMHTPQTRAFFVRRLHRLDTITNNVEEGVCVNNEVIAPHKNEAVNVDDDDDGNNATTDGTGHERRHCQGH
jgi:hypothetical protein